MKTLLSEIRMLIAEKLLGWAFSVSPDNWDGRELKEVIVDYFDKEVKQSNK